MITRTASFPIYFPGMTKSQKDLMYQRLYNEERFLRLSANKIMTTLYAINQGVMPHPSLEDKKNPGLPLATPLQEPMRDEKGSIMKQIDPLSKKKKIIYSNVVDKNGNYVFINEKMSYETISYRLITNNNIYSVNSELHLNEVFNKNKIYNGQLSTANLASCSRLIAKKFSSDKLEINSGEKTIANFKNFPIIVRADQIDLQENLGGFRLKIFNEKEKRKIIETKLFCSHKNDSYLKNILKNIFNKSYKIGDSRLIKKNKKWFFEMTYSYEPEILVSKNPKVLGIDLGISKSCVCAVVDYDKKKDDKVYSFMLPSVTLDTVTRISKEISKRSVFNRDIYEQRVGRGINRKIRNLKILSKKRMNAMDTAERQIAATIVNLAIKNNCDLVGMENLVGWSYRKSLEGTENLPNKQKRFLRKLYTKKFRHSLLIKIENAAKAKGIKVIYVNAKNTSKTCSSCGNIKTKLSLSEREYVCSVCSIKIDRDFNAAINIAHRSIDDALNAIN